MPRLKLTKSAIDALPTPSSDVVYWDAVYPGFGVKVTPKGRKVFIVLYRTGGAGSHLRKYTIGPYGRVTLHQARVAAQKVFAAKLVGRDPAAEKREAKRRVVADRVDDLLEDFIAQRLSKNRSVAEISRTPFVGRWESHGRAAASTNSLNEMWLKSFQQSSNAARPALPTRRLSRSRRSCVGAWVEPSLIDPRPRVCHCQRRRLLATECWTTGS